MTELPSGVDNMTMRLAIAWQMVEQAIAGDYAFAQAQPDDRMQRIAALFKAAYEIVSKS